MLSIEGAAASQGLGLAGSPRPQTIYCPRQSPHLPSGKVDDSAFSDELFAVARPMPELPPVVSATLSPNLPSISVLCDPGSFGPAVITFLDARVSALPYAKHATLV